MCVYIYIYNSHGSYVKGLYEEEDEKFYIFIILFFANFFLKNVIILSLNWKDLLFSKGNFIFHFIIVENFYKNIMIFIKIFFLYFLKFPWFDSSIEENTYYFFFFLFK